MKFKQELSIKITVKKKSSHDFKFPDYVIAEARKSSIELPYIYVSPDDESVIFKLCNVKGKLYVQMFGAIATFNEVEK